MKLHWIIFCVLIAAALGGCVVVFNETKSWKDTFETSAAFITAISIVYTVLSYQDLIRKNKEDDIKGGRMLVFNIVNDWSKPPLIDYQYTLYLFREQYAEEFRTGNVSRIYDLLMEKENSDSAKAIAAVFNYFEVVSRAIIEKLLDEAYFKEYFEDVFCRNYDRFMPYIHHRRQRKGTENIWNNYEAITKKWIDERANP